MTQPTSVDAIVRRDQARAILDGLPSTLVSNVFVSFSLVGMTWGTIPLRAQVSFVGANVAINAGRAVLGRRWRRQGIADRAPERVLTFAWIGGLLSGLCWAGALVACAVYGQAYTIAVAVAFSGLNAGSIIQNKVARAPAIAFVLPNTLIMVALFVVQGSLESQIIAMNLTLLCVLMFRWSLQQEEHYLRSRRLHYDAIALTDSLQAANVAAGEALRNLEQAATHDHLTGLFNRAAYQKAVEARLAQAATQPVSLWLMLIDLDRFKWINDTFGHSIGDEVLIEVGVGLRQVLGPDAVIARLGGDEFAALVGGHPTEAAGAALAESVVRRLGDIVTRSGQALYAGASVGVAHHPFDGRTLAELQTHADLALYAAKSEGRGTWRPFVDAMDQQLRTRREIERDLPEALETGAIQAWFQPQIDCATGLVIGFEALLRWKHPQLGWIAPPDAIAAAAATRRSRDLTRVILRDACALVRLLDASGHHDPIVSVNISPNEFGTYPIADMVAAELTAHGLSAGRIAIEITEEAVYSNERGGEDVDALIDMGVSIIVDDFGVAYSSIGSLRTLRFDSLKVDRSFIHGIADNLQDRVLLEAILAFARTLGVTVLAEGVETRAQFELLRRLGCPAVQGYHFARAMPPTEALAWITGNDLAARITRRGWAAGTGTIAARRVAARG
ncbi:putative bifunctional diguanylate cyclase/phosphodiesterase [Methylobacterium flocculans]|uniref:putative bifunctional diguanylate cyclase/phosphodiesterase n=1 Tax=Methylobacterium flocculans TaxID=2984843 RepID=UPI0021F2631A|nr:EAL domain-containing protein [Methylobacterium sp. FF17]